MTNRNIDDIGRSNSITMLTRTGFSFGDFSFNLIWQGTALFLMYYYTDVVGIAPAVAGTIYLIAMIWDAITDPIIAALADRTRTKWGRYRPWLLFGALPFAVSYPLAFSSFEALPVSPVIWALFTHILLRTTYTIVGTPFNSLQARLTDDAQERSVIAGFRMVGAALGSIAVIILTPVLVSKFGDAREAEAYFMAACLSAGFAFIGIMFCFFTMREPKEPTVKENLPSLWDDIKSIGPIFIKNPPLIRVFGVIVIGSICLSMFSKNILYYFKYDVGRPELIMWALFLPVLLFMLMVPIWVWVAGRKSKKTALTIGMTIALFGYLAFFFNPSHSTEMIMATILLISLGTSSLPVMFWSMLPDTVEYGEAISGIRAEAKTFGFGTFAQKSAIGINALILGFLLSSIGFEANEALSESTLLAMKAVMALVPALGTVLIIGILYGYDLDQKRHAELKTIIRNRKEAGA